MPEISLTIENPHNVSYLHAERGLGVGGVTYLAGVILAGLSASPEMFDPTVSASQRLLIGGLGVLVAIDGISVAADGFDDRFYAPARYAAQMSAHGGPVQTSAGPVFL